MLADRGLGTADLINTEIDTAARTDLALPLINLDEFTVAELYLFARAIKCQAPVGLRKAELRQCIEDRLTSSRTMLNAQQQQATPATTPAKAAGPALTPGGLGTPVVRPKEPGRLAPTFGLSPTASGDGAQQLAKAAGATAGAEGVASPVGGRS